VGEPAETLATIAREFSLTNAWAIWVAVYSYGGEEALVQALQANLEAGEMPGLLAAQPYLLSGLAGDYALVDLSTLIEDPEWGFDAERKADILPPFQGLFTREEQITALPFAHQATVLFYNSTWAAELGFSGPPSDLDTFRFQNCEATFSNWQDDSKQNGTGGWVVSVDPHVLASWYYAFEGVLPEEGVPSFNNLSGQAAFGYLWDLRNQGCSWFSLQPDPFEYFARRLALVYAGRLDQIPVQMHWMEAIGSSDEWELIGFPGPAGESVLIDGPGLMVTADTPENELAAWLFIQYLLEPHNQAKIVRSFFSLPMRESTLDLLSDFENEYPQWAQAVAMMESASILPTSDSWGVAQWVLHDAAYRILVSETGEVTPVLEQLDALIIELTGTSQ
jgi:ABC-type glycerol-3-phosphate transport system substrate-binding protein